VTLLRIGQGGNLVASRGSGRFCASACDFSNIRLVMQLLVLIFQGIFMILVALGPLLEGRAFDFSMFPLEPHKCFGLALNLLGTLICYLAVTEMKRSFAITAAPAANGQLVTSGVFRLCRNPIYFGGMLLCIGWSLSFWSWASAISTLCLFLVLIYKISLEEAFLELRFGAEYDVYRSNVRRLIPFVL
jgi:protein-S-isoprenylcysteine O-methyltransferase Ste14